MKKILVALMAIFMTMGLMAQCPQQKTGCSAQQAAGCQVKKECVKRQCVYSPETRAMMAVDRLSHMIKDLTSAEREQLLTFYKAHYTKCEERKASANPMTKEECRNERNAELRRVLGDDRYIKYLEMVRAKKVDCEMRRAPHSHSGERPCVRGERHTGCQKSCTSTCTKK